MLILFVQLGFAHGILRSSLGPIPVRNVVSQNQDTNGRSDSNDASPRRQRKSLLQEQGGNAMDISSHGTAKILPQFKISPGIHYVQSKDSQRQADGVVQDRGTSNTRSSSLLRASQAGKVAMEQQDQASNSLMPTKNTAAAIQSGGEGNVESVVVGNPAIDPYETVKLSTNSVSGASSPAIDPYETVRLTDEGSNQSADPFEMVKQRTKEMESAVEKLKLKGTVGVRSQTKETANPDLSTNSPAKQPETSSIDEVSTNASDIDIQDNVAASSDDADSDFYRDDDFGIRNLAALAAELDSEESVESSIADKTVEGIPCPAASSNSTAKAAPQRLPKRHLNSYYNPAPLMKKNKNSTNKTRTTRDDKNKSGNKLKVPDVMDCKHVPGDKQIQDGVVGLGASGAACLGSVAAHLPPEFVVIDDGIRMGYDGYRHHVHGWEPEAGMATQMGKRTYNMGLNVGGAVAGALAGQSLIPIPVVGGMIGATVGGLAVSPLKTDCE